MSLGVREPGEQFLPPRREDPRILSPMMSTCAPGIGRSLASTTIPASTLIRARTFTVSSSCRDFTSVSVSVSFS